MPTAYHIDVEHRLVRSRAWGTLTDAESVAHYRGLAADRKFQPEFRQICDLRDVTDLAMSTAAIRGLAQENIFARGVRRAFVAEQAAHYGLARMLQALCEFEGTEVGVFRSLAEAEAWLELAPGTLK